MSVALTNGFSLEFWVRLLCPELIEGFQDKGTIHCRTISFIFQEIQGVFKMSNAEYPILNIE